MEQDWRQILERKIKEQEWQIQALEEQLRDLRLSVAKPFGPCDAGLWAFDNARYYGYEMSCSLPEDVFLKLTGYIRIEHDGDMALCEDRYRAYKTEQEAVAALERALGYD